MADLPLYFLNLLAISLVFLPIYRFCSGRWTKQAVLLAAGVWMLYAMAPRIILFYIPYWLLMYGGCRLLTSGRLEKSRVLFPSLLVLAACPMVIWKLVPDGFFVNVNLTLHHLLWDMSIPLGAFDATYNAIIPIGLSFNTFRAMDILIQSRIGLAGRLGFMDVMSYGLFPPVMAVGPIIEYREIGGGFGGGRAGIKRFAEDLAHGLFRVLCGFVRIFLLALPLGFSKDYIFTPSLINSPVEAWFYLFVYTIFFYLNFAGYSDLAIGTARMYGFNLLENFNNPYLKPDLQQFWANWHMSLTRFAQRNVFVPLGGYRKKTQYLAVGGTMMVIALWHDISLSMVLFGLLHAAVLIHLRMHAKFVKKIESNPYTRALGTLVTFIFFMLTVPLLSHSLEGAAGLYGKLFGVAS